MIKEPYYLVDFNVSLVNFDIFINDVLAFSHQSGGSIHSNYPVNHFILKSGIQKIKVRFSPLAKSQSIHQDATAIIKMQYLDASTMDQSQLKTVYEYQMKNNQDAKNPVLEAVGEFNAEVPYQLSGWADAIAINPENQTASGKIYGYYKHIYTLFKNKEINALATLLKKRYEETDVAMYLEEDNTAALHNIFNMLEAENYIMQDFPAQTVTGFYANDRVINLFRPDHSPIISYLKKDTAEEFGFPFYIYLPRGKDEFEIIR